MKTKTSRFTIRDQFYLDNTPCKIISGSIHYFRVVPEYWRDRLEKLKAMGCNTVETYVPWNLHEPKKGRFDFTGILDIARFLKTAQDLGLHAIVRPSPYICAEWEFGGFPAWLMTIDGMRLRSTYGPYLDAVRDYYKELFKILAPLQIDNGGPIILMQIENEYGAYGDEKAYLNALRDMMLENSVTVPLVTSDGPWGDYLANGSLPGIHPTANFGSKAKEQFGVLKERVNGGPLMCMEFWVGWFDAWGDEAHHTTSPENCAMELDEILKQGNVNIYMFHGGTNFGFMNGSNYYGKLAPDVTSYDYDSPLSEDGEITPKYEAMREVIRKYAAVPEVRFSTEIEKRAYGKQPVSKKVSLFSVAEDLAKKVESPWPLPMEKLGQGYGYMLYRSKLPEYAAVGKIRLMKARDRANIFFDGQPFAIVYDNGTEKEVKVKKSRQKVKWVDILAENMGRVNYGPSMDDQRKGIAGSVLINGHAHSGWEMYPLPMDKESLAKLDFSKEYLPGTPSFYLVEFAVESLCDTFLDLSGWGKGCAVLNGFNLGRFWEKGPQKRLYVPAPLLKKGVNQLIVFESDGTAAGSVSFEAKPGLNP